MYFWALPGKVKVMASVFIVYRPATVRISVPPFAYVARIRFLCDKIHISVSTIPLVVASFKFLFVTKISEILVSVIHMD
jgi:hypothetical protein